MNDLFPMLRGIDRHFVGFDRLWNDLANIQNSIKTIPNYPPYNIKKAGEDKYTIEMAVAGLSKSDIDIELDGDTLRISGSTQNEDGDYVFKGIAERAFSRTFKLADSVEIKNATLVNGMLKITLENMMKALPSKKIDIQEDESVVESKKPELLTEKT